MKESTARRLTTRQAADFLGVKPATLEVWRTTRRYPLYCKLGGLVKYRLADLESFVESRMMRP